MSSGAGPPRSEGGDRNRYPAPPSRRIARHGASVQARSEVGVGGASRCGSWKGGPGLPPRGAVEYVLNPRPLAVRPEELRAIRRASFEARPRPGSRTTAPGEADAEGLRGDAGLVDINAPSGGFLT